LGKDTEGEAVVMDLKKMPHLLVAGATGSGKSVSLNAMITSILYKSTPDEVRFLLVDMKRLELGVYEGVPHLLHSVITTPKESAAALKWAVREMEERYRMMAERGVRNVESFNKLVQKELDAEKKGRRTKLKEEDSGDTNGTQERTDERPLRTLPYILIIIDELADLMMVAAREVEESIARLAQMARASGIHLILATQRPSVDVLTGLIKANFPARISFQVAQKVDSRTILDSNGAERLLGDGDMLFLGTGSYKLKRIHGAYVSEQELRKIADFLKQTGAPQYDHSIVISPDEGLGEVGDEEYDERYDEAVSIVTHTRQASISMIQRRLRVGYNRAARMIERMEMEGIVGPSDGVKPREVLIDPIQMQK
jgi:S-DNA-T family DNA segregation ATPase FtsK/SpoIIIE